MKNNKEKDRLKDLISHDMLDTPPGGFTRGVFNKLNLAHVSVRPQPVISKLGWIITGITVAAILLLSVILQPGSATITEKLLPVDTGSKLFGNIQALLSSSYFLLASMISFAIFILYTIDSWFRKHRLQIA